MTRLPRVLSLLLTALVLSLAALPVHAQSKQPVLETAVSERETEVGRPFSIQLSAMVNVSDRTPGNPSLPVPPGIKVRNGPSIMPKTHVTLNGPNLIQQMGIVATWTVEASRPGRYRIGPPTVTFGGKLYAGAIVDVVVHPRGAGPARPRARDPFDLFDIFGLPKLPSIFDDPMRPLGEPELPPTDPALAMTSAPAQGVFLHAMTDKTTVVLGEQVTLSVYEYFQYGGVRKTSVQEPSTADFLQYPVLDPSEDPGVRQADVGSSVWNARLVRKVALFPLRVGELTIGPMRVGYQGRGLRGDVMRESRPLRVVVQDAPAKGRPVGFRPGDVGEFSMSAAVEPREVDAGGGISVRVKVEGTGNLPSTLSTPSQKGLQWLDPDVKENIEALDGRLRGERVFSYIVKLHEPGAVDLGQIELPYYDPQRKRYEIARAYLGHVTVRENPSAPAAKAEVDRFEPLGGPRMTLGEATARRKFVTDELAYWVALFAMPLGVVIVGAGWTMLGATRRSVRTWRESLGRRGRVSLREAKRARKEGRTADAAAEVEKATHAMIEAATGLKSRGVLRSDLRARLVEAGASEAAAGDAVAVLEACESLRFDPTANQQKADALIDQAMTLARHFGKSRKAAG